MKPATRCLPTPDTHLWYHKKREQTYKLPVKFEENLIDWLFRLGFEVDQSACDLNFHWIRFYNIRRADSSIDWRGARPHLYNRGALGVQIDFRNVFGPTQTHITIRVWRQDANPD